MTTLNTYAIRAGNAIPIMCDHPTDPSNGNIVFTFGIECQETIYCGFINEIIKSSDMCLLGGSYFTASYKALPGRVNGQIVFQSNLTKKPILSATYDQCANSNNGGGGIFG